MQGYVVIDDVSVFGKMVCTLGESSTSTNSCDMTEEKTDMQAVSLEK